MILIITKLIVSAVGCQKRDWGHTCWYITRAAFNFFYVNKLTYWTILCMFDSSQFPLSQIMNDELSNLADSLAANPYL